jgi:hypothetical protein
LAVIVCSVGLLGSLVVALATAATGDDPLEFGIVGIDARVGGDAVHSSGAVIDADKGLVLTTARSVWGATSLRMTTGVGVLYGRIVARAPCSDVALIEIQPRIPGLTALKGGGALTRPPDVVARSQDGRVVHLRRPVAAGAPVVDDGRIAGVAAGGAKVIPWALIDQRLSELQPGPRRVYVGWRDEYACTPKLNATTKARHPGFQTRDAVLNAPVAASRVPGTEGLDK